jgi:hydroxylaminobenzene mutase
MERPLASSQQALWLLRVGVGLVLAAALVGLAVPFFAVPRLALSAHLVGLLQGILLLIAGLLWPRLSLRSGLSTAATWLLIYQGIAAPSANALAAAWTAGGSVVPMAAAGVQGSPVHEAIVNVGLRSAGGALVVALVLVLWGLRR